MADPTSYDELIAREHRKVKTIVERRGLCGLANNTKWDEFFGAMRADDWTPLFRCKHVDAPPSTWHSDWWNIPAISASIEWLDLRYTEEIRDNRLPPNIKVVDHSPHFEELLRKIGLEYMKAKQMIRIFGYSPKDLSLFDE
jgi:hypothetical protein